MTFWEHLDELRKVIFRSFAVLLVLMTAFFLCKEFVFDDVVLAPLTGDFFVYRWLDALLEMLGLRPLEPFRVELVNIDLAAQFFTHVRISFWLAVIVALPLLIWQVWLFVRPALYEREKHAAQTAFGLSSLLFYVGVAVGYLVVFPLTLRFLGTYQVSESVANQISLLSYIGMFLKLNLIMGVVFELPALALLLSRIGIINKVVLRKFRRYAIVAALAVSAVITPSGDAFTMIVVALPLYLLYEVSIVLCKDKQEELEVINDIDK
ncbi:MAG TPA: twin-arginine translocase subunit TatC [Candidatus Coprenecus pullistercoris]|nr:twin-arginine translocase subunit TatC [Candidatus Coprenecus pullistercoris]